MKVSDSKIEVCLHCQTTITHTRIENENQKVFCCDGCLQVFNILSDEQNGLYYQLCDLQDTKPPQAKASKNYLEFLKELKTEANLLDKGKWTESIHTVTLTSPEMHCSACTWLIEKVLTGKVGVINFEVHFIEGSLKLSYDSTQAKLSDLLFDISKYGYTFSFQKKSEGRVKGNHSLFMRMAVSSAIFSNVMIFSIANYFGYYTGILNEWSEYFTLISLILNIPIVTWCAYPFYKRAYQALTLKILHMDLLVSLGVLLNFGLSTYFFFIGREGFFDGLAGIVFFLLIGRWAVQRFENSLLPDQNWFENLFPQQLREKKEDSIFWHSPEDITKKMELLIQPGEYIPVESKLTTPIGNFDPSFLTGETHSIHLIKNQKVPAGYKCIQQPILVETQQTWVDSSIEKIRQQWDVLQSEKSNKPRGEKIVPYFISAILILCTALLFIQGPSDWLGTLETIGVVFILSCPCALALSKPLSMGLAMNRARKAGYLVRHEEVIEKLASIQTLLLDKTGTLTFTEKKITHWNDSLPSDFENDFVKKLLVTLCSCSDHPISRSINKELEDFMISDFFIQFTNEVIGKGIEGTLRHKDSTYTVQFYKSKSKDWNNDFFIDGMLVVQIRFNDEIRPSVKSSFNELTNSGYQVEVLSGDSQSRVDEFCKSANIESGIGDLLPHEKENRLQTHKRKGSVLAFGDGLNDTLLISSADVGVLARGGLQSLASGVDIISLREDLESFPYLFNLGKKAHLAQNISYSVSLVYNAAVIAIALTGFIAPIAAAIAMPLSSFTVCLTVWIVLRPWKNRKNL